jgi:hypothetical protein
VDAAQAEQKGKNEGAHCQHWLATHGRPTLGRQVREPPTGFDGAYVRDPVVAGLGVPRFTDAAIGRARLHQQARLRQIRLFQKHFAFEDTTGTYFHRSSYKENRILPILLTISA